MVKFFIPFDYPFYACYCFIYLFYCCPIGYPDVESYPAFFHRRIIHNTCIDEQTVRNCNQSLVKPANPGCPESHIFDRAFDVSNLYPIPKLERFVRKYSDGTKKVAYGILRSKCEGEAPNTQSGKQGCYIVSEILKNEQYSYCNNKNAKTFYK